MLTAIKVYRVVQLLMAVFAFTGVGAQQANSVHIQSENNQPYYVQWKGSSYSSSSTGYLVIPQVPPGGHNLVVGFERYEVPGYALSFTITDKSRAFTLRQGIDNSLSLFDMVSFDLTRGTIATKEQLDEASAKAEPPAPKPAEASTGGATEPGKDQPPVLRVKKIFDKASAEGIDQVYIVFNGTKMDTVALFIPVLEGPEPKKTAFLDQKQPANKDIPVDLSQKNAQFVDITRRNAISK
jgi:hypothetical protein